MTRPLTRKGGNEFGLRRLARVLAIACSFLLLLVLLEPVVVKAASETVSPPSQASSQLETPKIGQPAGDGPVHTPSEPPQPIPPGAVTQGWDNSSLAPVPMEPIPTPTLGNGEFSMIRDYGAFVFDRESPAYMKIGQDTRSVFTVSFEGVLLPPSPGIVVEQTDERVVTRHEAIIPGDPWTVVGTLTTTYTFAADKDKITVVFAPKVSEPDKSFQVVWLVQTDYESFLADGVWRHFSAAGLVDVAAPDFKVGVASVTTRHVVLDFDDAAQSVVSVQEGLSTFDFLSRNTVVVTFAPGVLTIDPKTIDSAAKADSLKYSIQRKTFFDGERYWVFWYEDTDVLWYSWSFDGQTWSAAESYPWMYGIGGPAGFTIANFGTIVAIVWANTAVPELRILTGVLGLGSISWDGARQLLAATGLQDKAVGAAFTISGTLAFTYITDDAYYQNIMLGWFVCSGPATGPCSSGTVTTEMVWSGNYNAKKAAFPVPFKTSDHVAVVAMFTDNTWDTVVAWVRGATSCGGSFGMPLSTVMHATAENFEDIYAAAPAGASVTVIWSDAAFGQLDRRVIYNDCMTNPTAEVIWTNPYTAHVLYISAGTEMDGATMDFAFTANDGAGTRRIYTARTNYGTFTEPPAILSWASDASLAHVSVSANSERFMPIVYGSSTTVKYTSRPLPADTFAYSSRNPWSGPIGGMVDADFGMVNPDTGLLSLSYPLFVLGDRGGTSVGLSLLYRQSPYYYQSGGTDVAGGYPTPPASYGNFQEPGLYLDLPWIDENLNTVHLQGGQSYQIYWNSIGGNRWFNNTNGVRFNLHFDCPDFPGACPMYPFVLTSASGLRYQFYRYQQSGLIATIDNALMTNNVVAFSYDGNWKMTSFAGIGPPPSRTLSFAKTGDRIDSISTPLGSYTLGYPGAGKVVLTTPSGRQTAFMLNNYRLTYVDFPTGGSVVYTFATYGSDSIWLGSDTYSLPVTQRTVYSQTGTGTSARTVTYTYRVQNGEMALAGLGFYEGGAVMGTYKGTTEYRYRPFQKMISVRNLQPTSFYLRPNLPGDYSGWSRTGCTVNWDCVDEATSDGDATYVSASTSSASCTSLYCDLNSLEDVGEKGISAQETTISSVVLTVVAKRTGTASVTLSLALKLNGQLVSTTAALTTLYASYTFTRTTDPSGIAWTMENLGRLQVGQWISATGGSGVTARVTQVYVTVTLSSAQVRLEQNWYSTNGQPHFTDEFLGDSTARSYFTQDYVDEWGNPVYKRDALGHERFVSYANTANQDRFYSPALLDRTTDGRLLADSFDFYKNNFAVVSGTPTMSIVDTDFRRYMPSLQLSGSGTIRQDFASTTRDVLAQVNLKMSTTSDTKIFAVADSSGAYRMAIQTSGSTLQRYTSTQTWTSCSGGYSANVWYRLTFLSTAWDSNRYKVFWDGVEICNIADKGLAPGSNFGRISVYDSSSAATVWMDDIKVDVDCAAGGCSGPASMVVDGSLLIGRNAYLLATDGSVISKAENIASVPISLSYLPSTFMYEVGTATIRVTTSSHLEEYVSPFKALYGGDRYTYTPPRTFGQYSGFYGVGTMPGADLHSAARATTAFLNDCKDAALCYDMETFFADGSATREIDLSANRYDGNVIGSSSFKTILPPGAMGQAKNFASAGDRIEVGDYFDFPATSPFSVSFWINSGSGNGGTSPYIVTKSSGGQGWQIVKDNGIGATSATLSRWRDGASDPTTVGFDAGAWTHVMFTYDGSYLRGYKNGALISGPIASSKSLTDTTQTFTIGNSAFTLSASLDQFVLYSRALSANEVAGVYRSRLPLAQRAFAKYNNEGTVAEAKVQGLDTTGAGPWLYQSFTYDGYGNVLTATDAHRYGQGYNTTSYSYSAFYSSIYPTKVVGPDSRVTLTAYDFTKDVPTETLGSDCLLSRTDYDAVGRPQASQVFDRDSTMLAYFDMDMPDGSLMNDNACAGTTNASNGNDGTIVGTTVATGVVGKARDFHAGSDEIAFAMPTINQNAGAQVTVSFWMYWRGTTNQMPFGFNLYDLYHTNGYFGFNTGNGDLWGISSVGMANKWVHVVAVFYNGYGTQSFLYVNGVYQPLSQKLGTTLSRTVSVEARVSGWPYTGAYKFDGMIDEFRVFNRAISAFEVMDLYRNRYKLYSQTGKAYDDMTNANFGGAYDGYNFHSVSEYDGVSIPRQLYLDMDTVRATINTVAYLEDLSGNGNNGKVVGPSSVAGKIGNGRQFDAVNDYVDIGDRDSQELTRITVAFWVKFSGTTNQWSVSKWISGNPASSAYLLAQHYTGVSPARPGFFISDGTSTDVIIWPSAVSDGAWHHLAATFDGDVLRSYLDGTNVGTVDTALTTLNTGTTTALVIGQESSKTNWAPAGGILDEVHIIGRALSSTEVSALYAGSEKSHVSTAYFDGLGRATKSIVRDMFGNAVTSKADYGWNDRAVKQYPPATSTETNKVYVSANDILGRALTTQAPANGVIASSIYDSKNLRAEGLDWAGGKAYSKADLIGREIEDGAWNPQTGTYANVTTTNYDGSVKVTDAKGQKTTTYGDAFGNAVFSISPDGKTSRTTYDDNQRVWDQFDMSGRRMHLTRDVLGQAIQRSVYDSGGAEKIRITYDFDPTTDNLWRITKFVGAGIGTGTPESTMTRAFDTFHRMTGETLAIGSEFSGTVSYYFDTAGRLASMTLPNGGGTKTAKYSYDSLGRVYQVDYGVSGSEAKYAVVIYDAASRPTNIRFWNAGTDTLLDESYNNYDLRDRVGQIKVSRSGTTYMQLDYTYNGASEITGILDNMNTGSTKTHTYTYDGNGFLVYANGPFASDGETVQMFTYTYDSVGNIATKTEAGTTTTYNYDPAGWNKLSTLTGGVSRTYTYNDAGSVLSRGDGWTYSYDELEEMTQASLSPNTYNHMYDGLGRHIRGEEPGATFYMYAAGTAVYQKQGAVEARFVYLGSKILFRDSSDETAVRFYHQDASRNVRLVTYYDGTTTQVALKSRYAPFGKAMVLYQGSGQGAKSVFWFAQQRLDQQSSLLQMGARYYDFDVGRFQARDPLGGGYAYANDNPLSYYDPTGLYSENIDPKTGLGYSGSSRLPTASHDTARPWVIYLFQIMFFWLPLALTFVLAPAAALAFGLIVGLVFFVVALMMGASLEDAIGWGILGFMIGTALGDGLMSFFPAKGEVWVGGVLRSAEGLGGAEEAGLSGADDFAQALTKDLREVPVNWATEPGTIEDLAQTNLRLHVAKEQAVRNYLATGRAAFESPELQGTRIHGLFKQLIRDDPFLNSRVLYNSRGVDVVYGFGPAKWELTTFRQVDAHITRFMTTSGIDGYGRVLAGPKDILDITWLLY